MKKIVSIFASVLAFGATAFAQNVYFDKTISGPNDKGVYTINLEAYVTGSITVTTETAPADIVLVLDYSGSMDNNFNGGNASGTNQRIYHLRNAVKSFVDTVKESDANLSTSDNYGGHRIAFVLYGGSGVFTNTGLNTFIDVDNLTTGNNSSSNAGSVSYNGSNLIGANTNRGGTPSDYAMEEANTLLAAQDYVTNNKRSRVVVFFTDGVPGEGQGSTWDDDRREVANDCINYAHTIKNAENYSATIYSVGLFNAQSSANETTTYLAYTSSDYKDKTSLPSSSSDWVNVSGDKSVIVSSSDALKNVFSSIATSAGGDYDAASSSSLLVDIVTSSFNIPASTDLGTVKVYKVACTKASADAITSFDTNRANWEDITNSVRLVTDRTTGEVSVTNYDYGAEWCGWNAETSSAHGHKLVLEIPIVANTDAVGGPDVDTNAAGSKLIIKDNDGNVISEHEFVSPVISLPVNIHIMKKGLGQGESAKFTIQRSIDKASWEYVTSVFVTNGDSSEFEVDPSDEKSYPVTYVRGLPSAIKVDSEEEEGEVSTVGYYYRIIEEDWSWNYSFEKATGTGPTGTVTVTDKNDVTTDKFITNPIIFSNTSDNSTVRHAESKATNIFSGSGTVIYDDSKPRTTSSSTQDSK